MVFNTTLRKLLFFAAIILSFSNKLIFSQNFNYENNIPVVIPPGFTIEDAFPSANFNRPVQLIFLPDGRKLVAEKSGNVWMISKSGFKISTPFIDISLRVLGHKDKGLLSIAIDPEFEINKWVYFLYTVDPDSDNDDNDFEEAWGRLERYQMSPTDSNIIDLETRQILVGADWTDGIPFIATDGSHAIGCIRFGEDNSILVSSGDGANFGETDAGGLNPAAFEPGKFDISQDMGAFRSQSLNSLCGKILRLNKETGEGLSTNPFWDGNPNSARSKVWVYGFRNPFRFTVRPGTGDTLENDHPGSLYIGDVGWSEYEDLNIAKMGGENFAWPIKEGIKFTSYNNVDSAYNGNTNVITPGNPENPSSFTNPTYWWNHCCGGFDSNPVGLVGTSSIPGPFYTGSAYPSEYQNNLFIADYGNKWIKALQVDSSDNIIGYSDFISNAQGPVNIETDPVTGDLFLITIGDAKIWRIKYPSGNYNPVISANVSPKYGKKPLTVNVDASQSYDPDSNDVLSFHWDFGNGDNAYTAIAQNTYTANGDYTIVLTLSDDNGGSSVKYFPIFVGKDLPDAIVLTPDDSSFFDIGEILTFEAKKINGPPAIYKWAFDFIHDNHIHPSQYSYTQGTVQFTASIPHEESVGVHYHWRARLTVTQGGPSNQDTIDIFPKLNLVPDSIWFTPPLPLLGLNFDTHVLIKNIGQVSSTLTNYKAYKGYTQEFTGDILPISQNDNITITIPMGVLDSTKYKIRFFADAGYLNYETDESDNWISWDTDIPVPVELFSFLAIYQNNIILLEWKTASEINNYGFEVERASSQSLSLQGEEEIWEKIGFVPGEGNSSSNKSYSFIDNNLKLNKYRYRLKQIDYNGTFKYSDIVEAIREIPSEYKLNQNYPNPFNPFTYISFAIPEDGDINLDIYNFLGNKVATLINEKRSAGYYTEKFNADNLASGVYFYVLQAGEFKEGKKLIILK